MSCVIHFGGDSVDVKTLISSSPVEPATVFRKGEPRISGPNPRLSKISGLNLVASEADFDDFETQKAEAISFLKKHLTALRKMRQLPGVDQASIDFGIQRREVFAQSDSFEPELTGLVAELGLLLMLSQYPASNEST